MLNFCHFVFTKRLIVVVVITSMYNCLLILQSWPMLRWIIYS